MENGNYHREAFIGFRVLIGNEQGNALRVFMWATTRIMPCVRECARGSDQCRMCFVGLGASPTQNLTWTPKVGKIMAFMAVIMGLGLLFYILLGHLSILG